MKLEDIGFYTLFDERATRKNQDSNLERCELLITSKCNFKCPYCRGIDKSADITYDKAIKIVDLWDFYNLQNIRFSGGEPTVIPWLIGLINYTYDKTYIKRIALSTNGSADQDLYHRLYISGVNDFSISLDACCAEDGDLMSGGVKGSWEKVIDNIKMLSELTYVTVGIVLTGENINKTLDTIYFAHELGVSDIRIIPAAQYNKNLKDFTIDSYILDQHPILKYRYNRMKNNFPVRSISEKDNNKCPLVLDDMVVKGDYHYPCIIKLREGCNPIGRFDGDIRKDRYLYYLNKNVYNDEVCRNNCLDVCVEYNNKWREFHE